MKRIQLCYLWLIALGMMAPTRGGVITTDRTCYPGNYILVPSNGSVTFTVTDTEGTTDDDLAVTGTFTHVVGSATVTFHKNDVHTATCTVTMAPGANGLQNDCTITVQHMNGSTHCTGSIFKPDNHLIIAAGSNRFPWGSIFNSIDLAGMRFGLLNPISDLQPLMRSLPTEVDKKTGKDDYHLIVPKIASQAVATTPTDRTRTTIGVAEEINLSLLPADLSTKITSLDKTAWTATGTTDGGAGIDYAQRTGATSEFKAGDAAYSPEVTATLPDGTTAKMTYSVLAPTNTVHYTTVTKKHIHGFCNVGFTGHITLEPATVSFYNIQVGEEMANVEAYGFFHFLNGVGHETSETFDGFHYDNTMILADTVFVGWESSDYASGDAQCSIPLDYKANGVAHNNYGCTELQEGTSDPDGNCTTTKNGTTETAAPNDSTVP